MAKEYAQSCSIIFVFKKCKLKQHGVIYLTIMVNVKRMPNADKSVKWHKPSYFSGGSINMYFTLENIWHYLLKLKICIPYHSTISSRCENYMCAPKDIKMPTATSIIVASKCKWSKCPSVVECTAYTNKWILYKN